MANALTLTSFAENIFRARDTVSRELIGFIPSVLMNSDSAEVSINGTVNSLVTAQPTLNTSYTPAMTIPSGDDQTISNATTTIGQVANVRIPLRGEDVKKLENVGAYQSTVDDMFAQAFRTIGNAIESHVGSIARLGASRAYGTSGTVPFDGTTKLSNVAEVGKILKDNGSPLTDWRLVIDSTAGAALRSLTQLTNVSDAGTADTLRRGTLLDVLGFPIRESAGVSVSTAGAMANATSTSAAFTVGQTVIPLATAGTGVVAAGDVITFANDTNQYVVASVSFAGANPASGDSITLAAPGLRKAQGVATRAITVTAAYTGNVAFQRNAIELIVRPPAQPLGGDAAADRMLVTDPVSGLVYSIGLYKGYGMNILDITTLYQAKVWKTAHVALLKG
jgi:hypothetical protein